MTYEQVKTLRTTEFKRLCGLYPDTFKDMVTVLKAEKVWQKKTGRPSKLSTEDQLLITLENIAPIFIWEIVGVLTNQRRIELLGK
jgi:hypothetical protein